MKKTMRIISAMLALCLLLTGCKTKDVVDKPVSATEMKVTAMSSETTMPTTTAATEVTTTTETEPTTTTTTTTTEMTASPTKKPTAPTTQRPTTSTVKPSGVTVVSGSGTKLSVEYVSQIGFPTGCESASATMLLRFWGVDMTLANFVDNYLEKGAIRYTSSGTRAPHPADKFVGDPRSTAAYGCYAPVIVRAIEKCLPSSLRVINETGTTLPQLCKEYLDEGMPVMVWGTIGMAPVRKGGTWRTEDTNEFFQWPAGEHCLLLVGYDSSKYYLLDPYQNRGLVSFPHATVEARFAELGYQAVGIQRVPTTTTTTVTTTAGTTTSANATTTTRATSITTDHSGAVTSVTTGTNTTTADGVSESVTTSTSTSQPTTTIGSSEAEGLHRSESWGVSYSQSVGESYSVSVSNCPCVEGLRHSVSIGESYSQSVG